MKKKNNAVLYWKRCFKLRKDSFFRDYVLNYYSKISHTMIWDSYGSNNPEISFYYIDLNEPRMGFFALEREILDALFICDEFHLVPYINISRSMYDGYLNNTFDFFYCQPSIYAKENVFTSKRVFKYNKYHSSIVEKEHISVMSTFAGGYEINSSFLEKLSCLKKKYLKYSDDVVDYFNSRFNSLAIDKSTIGVHYRGNGYKVGFYGHPVALFPEDYFPFIDECLNNGFKNIFVATDDANALNVFVEKYGNKVCFYQDTFRSSDDVDVFFSKNERKDNGYYLGLEVICDMLSLSKCGGLICGKSQVTFSSIIEKKMSGENFQYLKIIDKGLYQKTKKNIRARKEYLKKYSQTER